MRRRERKESEKQSFIELRNLPEIKPGKKKKKFQRRKKRTFKGGKKELSKEEKKNFQEFFFLRTFSTFLRTFRCAKFRKSNCSFIGCLKIGFY